MTQRTQLPFAQWSIFTLLTSDSNIKGQCHTARKTIMEAQVAREFKHEADVVVGVP